MEGSSKRVKRSFKAGPGKTRRTRGASRKTRTFASSHVRSSGAMKRRALSALANQATAGFLGLEKKFYDTGLAPSLLGKPIDFSAGSRNPSAVSLISTPTGGDSEQQRDGKRIVIKSVHVSGIVECPGINATDIVPGNVCQVYVALVLDTQTNGAAADSALMFKNTIANAFMNATPQRNLLFGSRFKILKSEVFDMDPPAVSHIAAGAFSIAPQAQCFNWYLPMELPVNFTAGITADVANVVDNSIHVVAFCTENTYYAPYLGYNARIRFMG